MRFPGEDVRWGLFEVFAVLIVTFLVVQSYPWWGPQVMAYLVYKGWVSATLINEFIFTYLIQFVVMVGAVLVLALVVRRCSPNKIGLTPTRGKTLIEWGIGGGILLFAVILVMGLILQRVFPEIPPQAFEWVLKRVGSLKEFVLLLVVISILAPLAEELYFRGFVYPVFRKYTGVTAGILLSGAFFGAAHFDLWRFIPLSVGGAILAFVYEKSGSIYPCWLAHGLWNGAMGLAYYFKILAG
ncbi:MAG TPA: CPBP family intramembrane metalloprotease [Syntrophothermus lipocalidus]|uniref:Abortive infection protein n=1 Tax=Syntrophothermus lipocalidus (strain DSM 12680 / TGB-C1) TaxID=643648 RepID=D7CL47_SYNLT|nr:type II CAAX endopeptidase family protein [Syntrophothermus lipocalidus]ADI01432.1 Abortive infection protein [Syntrophothermus lipocalidus DSM 12680]HHV76067.1 CPBP family intramembrane metalloprotease [Syntrophothermus lipocalidus]